MLIQGSVKANRDMILVDKYAELLNNGVAADCILVLLQNSLKKEKFIDAFKPKLKVNHFENPQIYTFYGLCYNTILNNWPVVENIINLGNPIVTPHLTGLEISRLLFSQAVRESDFKDYNSKLNLLHQLFRRYSLISNNNLSDSEVKERSNLLKEAFGKDVENAINIYKTKTIQYRAFDYLRQLNIFNYLYTNKNCFKNIKYLIMDDADEITPAQFDFVKFLYENNVDCTISYDRYGSSRLGFLNTDSKTVENIESLFEKEKMFELDDIVSPSVELEQMSFVRRQQMIQKALLKVEKLLNDGVKPEQISIVSPIVDTSLKFAVKEFFEPKRIDFQFISGNEKLCENILVKNSIAFLKLSIGQDVDIFEIRNLLSDILQIPLKHCLSVINSFNENRNLEDCKIENDIYSHRLKKFTDVLKEVKNPLLPLSQKLFIFYEKILLSEIFIQQVDNDDYGKFVFFSKQIRDFEDVFAEHKNNQAFQRTILNQISASIIAENPSETLKINEDSIVISTPQKIIDFSHKTKYQIWLDTTSHEWQHDDFGVLYNAWVFQKSWNKNDFTNDDNILYSTQKSRNMLRKLALLVDTAIYSFSSLYDNFGVENIGDIDELLLDVCGRKECNRKSNCIDFAFTPREDQKPVLDYTDGKMAISAVPGAGKTTILLALIIKLLQQGVAGENIFFLTYMDSAAKNFRERIKTACPNLEKLPNISTIHGLSLRILKENGNYVKVGLDENFDVCDDAQRQKILREVVSSTIGDVDDIEKYDKGISTLKLSSNNKKIYTKDVELLKFLKVYKAYNLVLKSKNLIDYDDMLSLSVKILESCKDIAEYYQDICKYIIEDEAQDSSSVQQKLISLLSEKHKNLIRCGDINQAITTTFTNTDLDGFREFINSSQNVLMQQSQRCPKAVYELANKLVDFAGKNEIYKNAFYDIKMQEVPGKNPISKNAVISKVFEDYSEERNYILENLRKIYSENKDATVAILVRNNLQVEEYSSYFAGFGYKVISGNESIDRQPVFKLLYSLMKFCAHPWLNETIVEFTKTLLEQKLGSVSEKDLANLQNLKSPFILCDNDTLDSVGLSQLLWDLNYWLENASLNTSVEDFCIKAGMYYYNTEIEKSNIYLIASFFKSIMSQYSTVEGFINRVEEIKNRPIGMKYKFFENDAAEEKNITGGALQIMTYHKSKGGEFDFVFVPSLNEEYLQFNPENIKIKSKERFLEAVKALNSDYKKKNEMELKLFQIEENFRLLYVAITRAQNRLFITTAKNCKKFSKVKKVEPSIVFDEVLDISGDKHV